MSKRKGKIRKETELDDPANSDSQINYTFEDDSENPFTPRPRLGKSPIVTRSRTIAQNKNLRIPVVNMAEAEDNHNLPFGTGDANISRPVEEVRLEDLTLRLERVLTLNHNVFMNELSSLRQTLVENLGGGNQRHNTSNNAHQTPNNNQRPANDSFQNRSLNSDSGRSSSSNISIRIDKWNISYDGSQDINDFLFKVDTLREQYNVTEEQVVTGFHTFLKGKAETWFWSFLKLNRNATYSQLKLALIRQFGKVENDCDRIVRMIERRQMSKETFDDYFTEMLNMNSRLSQPMSDNKMIDLIKNNVKESLASLLFSYDLFSLEHLRDAARKAEQFLAKQQQIRSQRRFVSEIDNREDKEEIDYETSEVAALQYGQFKNRNRKEIDTSKFKCWNCDQIGHSFYDCPSEKRNLFCFKCGEKNVSTPQCSKHPKNRDRSE
ncbi:uncharacterized protein LOC124421427 [Lucilia cuprina]|uniref:uncharacterized protein LOC124421427 n=1 Tax=Lucilia cuprina TaxID=7375 RepID=UPI001F060126|nr:uncharacterized protein LOC124421427 [Lucilia cuprina]